MEQKFDSLNSYSIDSFTSVEKIITNLSEDLLYFLDTSIKVFMRSEFYTNCIGVNYVNYLLKEEEKENEPLLSELTILANKLENDEQLASAAHFEMAKSIMKRYSPTFSTKIPDYCPIVNSQLTLPILRYPSKYLPDRALFPVSDKSFKNFILSVYDDSPEAKCMLSPQDFDLISHSVPEKQNTALYNFAIDACDYFLKQGLVREYYHKLTDYLKKDLRDKDYTQEISKAIINKDDLAHYEEILTYALYQVIKVIKEIEQLIYQYCEALALKEQNTFKHYQTTTHVSNNSNSQWSRNTKNELDYTSHDMLLSNIVNALDQLTNLNTHLYNLLIVHPGYSILVEENTIFIFESFNKQVINYKDSLFELREKNLQIKHV